MSEYPVAKLNSSFLARGLATFKHYFWVPFWTIVLLFVAVAAAYGGIAMKRRVYNDEAEQKVLIEKTIRFSSLHGYQKKDLYCEIFNDFGMTARCFAKDYHEDGTFYKVIEFNCDNRDCKRGY